MTTENEKPPNEEVKPGKFSTEAVTELIKVVFMGLHEALCGGTFPIFDFRKL